MRAIVRLSVLGMAVLLIWPANASADRLFDIDTHLAMKNVSEITASPDGEFLAYTISRYDLEKDAAERAVWMQPVAGGESVRMTAVSSSAWSPRWSPDKRYLAVLSDRKDGRTQVWLLDRRGGDARQLTEFRQGVRSYEWSPDGTRMLLLVKDPSPADLDEEPRPNPRPYVIDRLQFKRDYVGYLDNRRTHVHVKPLQAPLLARVRGISSRPNCRTTGTPRRALGEGRGLGPRKTSPSICSINQVSRPNLASLNAAASRLGNSSAWLSGPFS